MATFEYQAVNTAGERVSGTVLGGSIEQALTSLSLDGLTVERINQSVFLDPPQAVVEDTPIQRPAVPPVVPQVPLQAPIPASFSQPTQEGRRASQGPPAEQRNYVSTSILGPIVGMVPLKELGFFYRQFSTMLEAGVPIVQALDTLSGQGRNPKLSHVIREIRGHVEVGRPISAGMQRYPEVFPALAVSMVRAGEEGGFVAQSFALLSTYTEKEIALRNLIRRTTFYPKLVVFLSIPIVLGTNMLIASLGKSGGLTSPFTQVSTWIWLGPVLVGAFLYFRIGLANPRLKFGWDAFILKVPYLGETLKQLSMAKFGRAMGALYKGGVPVNRAIILAADACGNEYLRSRIAPAGRRLESGAGIGDTLSATGAFSPIVLDMIYTGERTGNLDSMMNRMADFYEDEGEVRANQTGHVLGVVALIAVALLVLYIVIQFIAQYASQIQEAAG